VIAELCRHEQQWVTEACGDQWLGFETPELHEWAHRAGFSVLESQYLAQKNGFRLQIHSYLPIQD
jgi:ArsR family transcriptional regulator